MSFSSPLQSSNAHLADNEGLHYFDLKEKLLSFKIMEKQSKLKIKAKTEKACLFEIDGVPLFWVPKKLIKIVESSPKKFYVNKCFDIKKELTS